MNTVDYFFLLLRFRSSALKKRVFVFSDIKISIVIVVVFIGFVVKDLALGS